MRGLAATRCKPLRLNLVSSLSLGCLLVMSWRERSTRRPYSGFRRQVQYDNVMNTSSVLLKTAEWMKRWSTALMRKNGESESVRSFRDKPSVPHPPSRSIKATTLRNLLPRSIRHILHRPPMLLRLLLATLGYFHPVSTPSITVACSGKWVKHILEEKAFEHNGDDAGENECQDVHPHQSASLL